MKKLIFVFVFALLGTYFQSAKAQTFSRVVTVTKNIDTTFGNNAIFYLQDTLLYQVPIGKIFKLEFSTGHQSYTSTSTITYNKPLNISINKIPIIGFPNYPATTSITSTTYQPSVINSSIWLKAGDRITIPNSYAGGYLFSIRVFLSGIEYDAQ